MKKRLWIKFTILFIFALILGSFWGCASVPEYKSFDDSNQGFLSHLQSHPGRDSETWLFEGILQDKNNYLYHFSYKLSKVVLEGVEFWVLDFVFTDYQTKQKWFYEETSLNPMSGIKTAKTQISLGKSYIKWNKDKIFLRFKNDEFDLSGVFVLKGKNDFHLFQYHSDDQSDSGTMGHYVSNVMESTVTVKSAAQQKLKGKLSGKIILYRDFFHQLMSEMMEIYFIQYKNNYYIFVDLPKLKKFYGVSIDEDRQFKKIDKISYTYNMIIRDKNRSYGVDWDFKVNPVSFSVLPYQSEAIYEGIFNDWWESLCFVMDGSGTPRGFALARIQEFTRIRYEITDTE